VQRITYTGPSHAVDVEIAPRKFLTVPRGETVEVADRLAESLLEQSDTWAPAQEPKKATTNKESAA
jgi:hypothetical protein